MRYEVSWMLFEDDEQIIISEQFNTLEKALITYNNKKTEQNVKHIRIIVILDEYYNHKMTEGVKVGESYDFLFEGKNNEYDEEYKDFIEETKEGLEK